MKVELIEKERECQVGDGVISNFGSLWMIVSEDIFNYRAVNLSTGFVGGSYSTLLELLEKAFPHFQRIIPSEKLHVKETQ